MKILIATPIVFEQTSPFNHIFQDIIGGFLEDGNCVVRLAAVENIKDTDFKYGYSEGKISYKLYQRKKSRHSNFISRYVRDNITALRQAAGILKERDGDILFEDVCYSSVWPVLAAKMKGIKVAAMLQDVWPDNAVQSGLISEGSIIYKFFEFWQKIVYRKADKVICISDDIKSFIVEKGVKASKIEVVYNWGYQDEIVNIPWEKNEFAEKYGLSREKFYAVYAGNIGKMQNVEVIIEAAGKIQHREDIRFLIIGDGVERKRMEKKIRDRKLSNVEILPFQPSRLAVHIYSSAGVNIIPLVNGGTKTALPSKTGIILSCGKPVIACVDQDSKFASMIREKANGAVVSPGDADSLAKKIEFFAEYHSEEYSCECFKEFFLRKKNIGRYKESIKKI